MESKEWEVVQVDILDGVVYDIMFFDNENSIYIGGNFNFTGQVAIANNIAAPEDFYNLAKMDVNTNEWLSVVVPCNSSYTGECANEVILSIAVDNLKDQLYIGGKIQNIQGVVVNGVAKLEVDQWQALGTGFVNTLHESAIITLLLFSPDLFLNNQLLISGLFTSADTVPVSDLCYWDTENSQVLSLSTSTTSDDSWNGIVFTAYPLPNPLLSTSPTPIINPTTQSSQAEGFDPLSITFISILSISILVVFFIIILLLFITRRAKYSYDKVEPGFTDEQRSTWEEGLFFFSNFQNPKKKLKKKLEKIFFHMNGSSPTIY